MLGLGDGQKQIAILIFQPNDGDIDIRIHHVVLGIFVQPFDIAAGNDTIALPAHIDDQALVIDGQDRTGHNVAARKLHSGQRTLQKRSEILLVGFGRRIYIHMFYSPKSFSFRLIYGTQNKTRFSARSMQTTEFGW